MNHLDITTADGSLISNMQQAARYIFMEEQKSQFGRERDDGIRN